MSTSQGTVAMLRGWKGNRKVWLRTSRASQAV